MKWQGQVRIKMSIKQLLATKILKNNNNNRAYSNYQTGKLKQDNIRIFLKNYLLDTISIAIDDFFFFFIMA